MVHNTLTKAELKLYATRFGEHVASWCIQHQGQQVLRGECWDLAHDALMKGCGNHAFVSTYTHHGYPILELRGTGSGVGVVHGPEDEVRPGDILQFKTARFALENGVQTAGDPDHTAVVVEKQEERIMVLEQNVLGVRHVVPGSYVFKNIVEGSVVVYRPVPAEWAK